MQKIKPRYAVGKKFHKTAVEIERAKNHLDKIYNCYRLALKEEHPMGYEDRVFKFRDKINEVNGMLNEMEASL